MSPFDVRAVRAQFPGLFQEVHGKPLVYLDNSATTQKPQAVIDAIQRAYVQDCSNVHRGVHALSQRATERYEGVRSIIRRFLNAESDSEIVFTGGTTAAINLVAGTIGRQRLAGGGHVLITGLEHHSNIVPWQLLGAELRVVPVRDDGSISLDDVAERLDDDTRFVSMAHISNALGTVLPIEGIIELAHARGVPVLVDGAQAVAHGRVDVRALGADFYAFSGHKVFGPTGIGALYGRLDLLEQMPPWQGGGDMIRTVDFEGSTWAPPPTRFEAGTPNIAGVIGLGAALEWLMALDLDGALAHEHELLEYATRKLRAIDGLHLIGTAEEKEAVLSFTLEGLHPHDVGTLVDRQGVAVRVGHHCAQPVMKRFGVAATTRASLALYNTREDIDRLVRALSGLREQMAEMNELYEELIRDHSSRPRNQGSLPDANREAWGHNPLCGDHIRLQLEVHDDRVTEAAFVGRGCAISTASASILTEMIKGKSPAEARALFERFHNMVVEGADEFEPDSKLGVFRGTSGYPARVKCATLPWHTLNAALTQADEPVTTE